MIFAALGLAIFVVDHALRGDAPEDAEPPAVIVIDAPIRDEVVERLEARLGRAPTAAERERALERWTEDEVLYREGLARGFDVHDPTVRARVASRMARVLREAVVVSEPTDEELRQAFEADRERWVSRTRFDITHVFVQGHEAPAEARAEELLALLRDGASPAGLGDRFSGGRRYRRRTAEQLTPTFGEAFVRGVSSQTAGEWHLLRSPSGLHVVRVDAVRDGAAPALETVRADVRRALIEEREEAAFRARLALLVARWRVRR